MHPVRTLVISLSLTLAAGQALAQTQSLTASIESQLRQQGFSTIVVSTTWLGRTRIDATSPSQKREIVINPRTGEILRDYWHPVSGATGATEDILDSRTNGNGSKGSATSDGTSGGSGAGSEGSGSGGNDSGGKSAGEGSGEGSAGGSSGGGGSGGGGSGGEGSD
jgi:hypothetical protein